MNHSFTIDKITRVVLICPPPLGIIEPWQDAPLYGRTALAYLAAALRTSGNYSIKIIDAKLERLGFPEVIKQTIDYKPDIVGFTAFTSEIKPSAYLSSLIKKNNPTITTIIGGVHVTTLPKQTLQEFDVFDIGVIGEGENTFVELCKAIAHNIPLNDINGLVFRSGNAIIQTAVRDRIIDQDSLPLPAWDLMPSAHTYYIQTERGCPFNCVFCVNHNGRVARKRSVESIMAEFEVLMKDHKPHTINFGDELFSVDVKRTHLLLDKMIEKNIGNQISWDCQTHVRFVDDELFVKMKKANVFEVHMGVETGDEESLRRMGKGTTSEMIIKAFKSAKKAKVRTGAFLIFGQPYETLKSINNTIDLAVKINTDLPMFSLMVPYPGTEVARLASRGEAGYTGLSTDWDDYRMRIGGEAMKMTSFKKEELEMMQLKGYLKVFFYNLRFFGFVKFAWNYRKAAMNIFKKIILKRNNVSQIVTKPKGYDEVFSKNNKVTHFEMIESKEEFEKIQKRETKRIRETSPHLIAEQKMI